jgi:putative salt-induced outer membrane protein
MMTSTIAALTIHAVHLGAVGLQPTAAPPDSDVPVGTVGADPASSGATELEGQGQFTTSDAEGRHAEDATELEISTGGLLSTGNAFAVAVTGQGRFRLRRGIHQMGVEVAGNYARADVKAQSISYRLIEDAIGGDRVEEVIGTELRRDDTVANIQARARYDVFFAERWSAFLMATFRRDRFQGLDARLNIDPGVAFHVLTQARHRLWLEAGYDFQYDARREEAVFGDQLIEPFVDADDDGFADTERVRIAEDTQVNHAVRIAAAYNNSLSDRVVFDTNLEYLQSVLVGRRFRVNWVSALTTQLADRLGLSVTYALRYENEPLPNVRKLDTITAVLLTVRFI